MLFLTGGSTGLLYHISVATNADLNPAVSALSMHETAHGSCVIVFDAVTSPRRVLA